MSKAEEVLKQGTPQQAQLNYDMSGYNTNYNNMLNTYKQQTGDALNNYKQLGSQNVNALKQQTQQQMAFLNQQLDATKQKYQIEGQRQEATINTQYKDANTQIDNQAFENYKMSNQMGATRGVSNSAQQMAMDNSVGQQTAGLFNQNLTNKNTNINDLKAKISSQMLDLDMQHASSVNDLQLNQMQKQMEIMNQMSEKEFDYVSSQADKIIQMQMSNNELQFNTQKEVEQYRSQLAVKLYEMQFSNAQSIDQRDFQSSESAKDRAFQASENAKNRALQSSISKSSGSEDDETQFTEDELLYQETLAYYIQKGMSPSQAREYAKSEVERYMNSQGKTNKTTQDKYAKFDSALQNAINKKATSLFDGVTPQSSTSAKKKDGNILDVVTNWDSFLDPLKPGNRHKYLRDNFGMK